MISESENRLLTEVEPGAPMGDYLRRFWHPVAAASDLEDHATKAVRFFGEDLVLYRDRSGTVGLLDRHCPHRRADLSYGSVEDCGLRCSYHGWLFDADGACLEQPFDQTSNPNSKFRDRATTRQACKRHCA